MKIGFIGLGIMGLPMAKNLVNAGHELVVLDRSAAREEEVVALGATRAATPAEVAAQVELVLTGRSAPDAVLTRADLVTEMRCVRHYYDRGVLARPGIDS